MPKGKPKNQAHKKQNYHQHRDDKDQVFLMGIDSPGKALYQCASFFREGTLTLHRAKGADILSFQEGFTLPESVFESFIRSPAQAVTLEAFINGGRVTIIYNPRNQAGRELLIFTRDLKNPDFFQEQMEGLLGDSAE